MINNITYHYLNQTPRQTANEKTKPAPADIHHFFDNTKPVSNINLMAYIAHFKKQQTIDVEFYNSPSIIELEKKYGTFLKENIKDLNTRAGKPGQVLNWIKILPELQLQRLDTIYELAESLKESGPKKLGIIGIGGSKHTIENLLALNNAPDKVTFLSSVDPSGMEKFINNLGDLDEACIIVASKSGTTLETSTGYEFVHNAFINKFKQDFINKGFPESSALAYAKEKASKHFICITDENTQKSKLRKIAEENGYKCGIIHDDCGGRFGAFDDHALIALAYCGMPKDNMKRLLESAIKAQKKYLNSDIQMNPAAQRALFNTNAIINGRPEQTDYYFGNALRGTLLWNTQLKKESHKSLYKAAGDIMGPEFLHNSAESDLDSGNKTSFYTFNIIQAPATSSYKAYNALIQGSLKAYSDLHPVSVIRLKDLSPESIAEFIELKHFETIYTGMLLRKIKGIEKNDILPEVDQPNVNIYKKEVEKILNT